MCSFSCNATQHTHDAAGQEGLSVVNLNVNCTCVGRERCAENQHDDVFCNSARCVRASVCARARTHVVGLHDCAQINDTLFLVLSALQLISPVDV